MQFTGVIGALALMLFGATVVAQTLPADDAGWYMGFGAGRSLSRLDGSSLTGKLDLPGFDPLATYTNSHATAYKAFGGYEFLRHFALEGSYFDLGRFSFAAPASPTGTLGGALRARGFGFDGVGLLPFTAKFGVFARLGGTYA